MIADSLRKVDVNVWLVIRAGIILVAVIAGCFVPLGPQAKPPIDWVALIVIFSACVAGLPLVIGVQRINPRSAKVWNRPSWKVNPLNFRDPLQFFHLGACLSMTQGLVVLIRMALVSVPFYAEALVPLAIGAGVWLGLKATVVLYSSKFAPSGHQ